MSSQKVSSALVIAWVAVPSLAILLGAGAALAQSSSANYAFLVGAGFLCDPGDSATCPAVARSANGDSYEMSGAGTLNTQSKSVTAAGTFTHKSSSGTVLETGKLPSPRRLKANLRARRCGDLPNAVEVGASPPSSQRCSVDQTQILRTGRDARLVVLWRVCG